jgi:hypothetical protein
MQAPASNRACNAGNGENGMAVGQRCFFKLAGWDAEENSIRCETAKPFFFCRFPLKLVAN